MSWDNVSGADNYTLYWSTSSPVDNTSTAITGLSGDNYTHTGLTGGATYYYKVAAVNTGGTSTLSSEVSATPTAAIPSAPTNLVATGGTQQVTVTWDNVSGADNYTLYWDLSSPVDNTSTPITAAANPYTHSGLFDGTTYYYRVSACNSTGCSLLSNEDNATTRTDAGSAPGQGNLTASGGAQQVVLDWDDISGSDNYTLFRTTSPGVLDNNSVLISGIPTSDWVDTPLDNGTTYYYRVAGVNEVGTGGLSNEANATTYALPGTTTLTARAAYQAIVLTWDNASDATSYKIYYDTSSGVSTASSSFTSLTGNTYLHGGLADGATYYYKIVGVNALGEGPLSNEANATTPTSPPAKVVNLTAIGGELQVRLSWDDVSPAADSYTIYWSDNGTVDASSNYIDGLGSAQSPLFYIHGGREDNMTYYYRVAAVKSGKEGELSDLASALTLPLSCTATASHIPDNDSDLLVYYPFSNGFNDNSSNGFDLTGNIDQIQFAKGCAYGAAGYFDASGGYAINTDFNDDNVSALATDNFTVSMWVNPDEDMKSNSSAFSSGDSSSTWNQKFQIDVNGASGAGNFRVFGNDNTTGPDKETWKLSANETYQAKRWYHLVFVHFADNTVRLYVNGDLSKGRDDVTSGGHSDTYTSWHFIRLGLNRAGLSPWKGYIDEFKVYGRSFSTAEVESLYSKSLPVYPDNLVAAPGVGGSGQINLSWTPVTGADNYTVYYSTSSPVTIYDSNEAAASNSHLFTGTSGVTYYFKVTANNAQGSGYFSDESSVIAP
ncbi:MAG: LamG-like jellyroll fold domain-containing protein [bacterium]